MLMQCLSELAPWGLKRGARLAAMQLFKSILGASSRQHSAKKPAAKAKPHAASSTGDYRAVSLTPCPRCAALIKDAKRRYLLREAPRLPLTDCAAGQCTCKFRKHDDRRDGDRRLLGDTTTHRWFAGAERRGHGGRRSISY
jgi:hypothetical protein